MIEQKNGYFGLHTNHTTYALRINETGQPEHLYYGRRIHGDAEVLAEKHEFLPGNTIAYSAEANRYSLEDVCLEMSSYGKGDIREPMITVIHADGSATSDFTYCDAKIRKGKANALTLPGSYGSEEEVEELQITMKDLQYDLTLQLYYDVYEACDVITRRAVLQNDGKQAVTVERLLSMLVDFPKDRYVFTTFTGAWAREMNRCDTEIVAGKYVNASYTGTSSGRANPFVMLEKHGTTETAGDCYGFNLIYSGNHYEVCEVNAYGKVRFASGIHPDSFRWILEPEKSLEAPEAVFTYSKDGEGGMSRNMHRFVRKHIVRGVWRDRPRPVLLNSWEAAYFDINESRLLKLAKEAANAGIELFVMDDGWFGEREDDTKGLGDWEPNPKKLPGGLKGLCSKIQALGLKFGLWVEPEMVNVNSNLYGEHPEYVLQIPDKPHAEGRNQRILDLTSPKVQDYVIDSMKKVFGSCEISYVKWDMNRIFTDYFSQNLDAGHQGEVAHRYILGLYRCMRELTQAFPDILFEGCAAGGNRFDLGILCYFPQIWASDDTDAYQRAKIQTGYSYGYPMSALGAHVSGVPNHQTLRRTPLETRFHVASFGALGYECNLCDMKKEELEAVKAQIALYKEWRDVFFFGEFYRGRRFENPGDRERGGNLCEWTVVSADGRKAVGMIMQSLVVPNTQYECYYAQGLKENQRYHFYNRLLSYNVKDFGDLVNTVSPVHIRQDSVMHNLIAKFVKMSGAKEDYCAYGDTLMYGGVRLKPAFAGTGYNENVRFFPDFSSGMMFMEAVEDEEHE